MKMDDNSVATASLLIVTVLIGIATGLVSVWATNLFGTSGLEQNEDIITIIGTTAGK